MKKVLISLNLIFLIFLSKQVDGRVIHVPSDSSTIQKGINGAQAGDTVLVAGGIYCTANNGETFPINMKSGVVLLSESGVEYTSIFADYDTTVIYCVDLDSTTIIQGFQIGKGKSTNGGGIYCENSSLKIIQNEISANEGTYGAGIYCQGGSPQIIDNLIRNNSLANQGGGIYCQNASPRIIDNEISNNGLAFQGEGGGIYCQGGSPQINENVISNNGFALQGKGGGIYCHGGSPEIIDNVITNNSLSAGHHLSAYGGGICCMDASCQVKGNKIMDNNIFVYGSPDPKGYGGGIFCQTSSGEITDNLIDGNSIWGNYGACLWAKGYGVGISCLQCTSLVISGNTIENDTFKMPASTGYGGGIYSQGCCSLRVLENIITNNGYVPVQGGQSVYGGGIYCTLSSLPIMQNNLIVDNKASSGGGLYFKDTIIDSLNNNTVDSDSVGGIYCENSTMKIFNNIVTNSTEGVGIKIVDATTDKVKIFYNNVWNNQNGGFENCPPGVGDTTWGVNNSGTPCDSFYNIIRDPLFNTHPDSLYHLQVESPCIDAGDSLSPDDPDGTIADMGAFYYDQRTEVTGEDEAIGITGFELFQNYPNPFNSVTQIRYELPKASEVKLTIYNILGQRVAVLANGREATGIRIRTWDGKDDTGRGVASGIYFYRIQVEDLGQSRKMLLLK